jgi:hypothetical protein
MKKHFFLALALAFTSVIIAFADQPNLPTQNGYPVVINFGFKDVATPTITINNAIVDLADYLPAGTIGFELRCASGSFVIGHPDNIATGTSRIGRLISEGETFTWNGLAGTFNGVIISNTGTATVVIDGAWGQYEE